MVGPHLTAWDIFLGRATRAVNTRTMIALEYTPFEFLFGIQPQIPFEFAYPDEGIIALRAFTPTTPAILMLGWGSRGSTEERRTAEYGRGDASQLGALD